jgi:hypothetical protein
MSHTPPTEVGTAPKTVVVKEVVGDIVDTVLIWFAANTKPEVAGVVVEMGVALTGTVDVATVMQDTVVVVEVTST